MKALIKQFIPPILVNLFKQKISHPKAYKSYLEAVSVCQTDSYQNSELAKVVIDKNLEYRKILLKDPTLDLRALTTLIALGLSKAGSSLNVIDFGGGGGYHYTIAQSVYRETCDLKWNVVETTAMTKEAQRMISKGLKFFDNIDDASKDLGLVDLVFTSNALQYCPSPLAFLKKLTELNAKYLFITRTAFSDTTEEIFSTQVSDLLANGPGTFPLRFENRKMIFPVTFSSKSQVESILKEKYHIQFTILEDKGVYKVDGKQIDMFGYFCVLKS